MGIILSILTDFVIPACLALVIPVVFPIAFGYMKGGAMHSPFYVVFGIGNPPNTVIEGFVAPGYEPVRMKLLEILADGMEEKVQVSAFVDGKMVVNLAGVQHDGPAGSAPSKPYNTESIQNVFSSTKALVSIVVAMLVDRGHLRYDQPIAELWPEFAAENKHDITLEQLLRHESGLEKFDFVIPAGKLHRDSLKQKAISSKIAASKSTRGKFPRPKKTAATAAGKHRNGSSSGRNGNSSSIRHKKDDDADMDKNTDDEASTGTGTGASATADGEEEDDGNRSYHFVTRDIILNEIVMRADPKGRTLGEIVRDDIATPLGIADQLTLGQETVEQEHKLFPLVANSKLWVLAQLLNPFKRKVTWKACLVHLFMMHSSLYYRVARMLFGPHYAKPTLVVGEEHGVADDAYVVDVFNHPVVRAAEIPSANGHASAYALAKVASVMAAGGAAHGVKLLAEPTYAAATGKVSRKYDRAVMSHTKFTTGGWNVFDSAFGFYRHGSIGWFGINGTVLQWHEELKIGFGYTCTLMAAELGAKNSSLVQNEVIRCAQQMQRKQAEAEAKVEAPQG